MEVMRLKHGYSLVIIILLFHNVALEISEEVDNNENEGDENFEPEEVDNTENEKEENIETNEVNSKEDQKENSIEEEEETHIEDDGRNSIEGEERNSIEEDERNSNEDEEQNSIEEEEINSVEKKEGIGTDLERSAKEWGSLCASYTYGKKSLALSARKPATFHWPSGMVPYYINNRDFDTIIAGRIRAAMHTIMSSSCVVFKDMTRSKPRSENDSSPWLSIENPEGVRECSHTTLRDEGARATKAILIVGYDCMQKRDILHALLHALGFEDEVTHPQRDLYIRVVWPNIQPKYRSLFYLKKNEAPQKVVEYDSMSVMHFHDRAYTINGGATILPQIPGLLIAPSDTLSQLDVMKLRLVFGHECNKRKVANLLRTCQNALRDNSFDEQDPDSDVQPTDTD